MPKILISSDHHHDNYKNYSRIIQNGITSRLKESLDAELFLHRLMRKLGITIHVRCGDLFDKKDVVDAIAYSEVYNVITGNLRCGIQEIDLVGNHDSAAGFRRNTLETFGISNVSLIVDEPRTISLYGVDFHFIPHMEGETSFEGLWGLKPNPDKPNLLFTHVGINGAKTGSEFLLPQYIDAEDLRPELWDFVFVGHIHEPQQLRNNMWYVGNLVQRNFMDEGTERRCFVLDIESGKLESIPIPGPRFHTVDLSSEEKFESFTPIPGDYYRCTLPYGLDARRARELFQKTAGVSFNTAKRNDERVCSVPVSVEKDVSWETICKHHVEQSDTNLDKGKLFDVARQILSDC
jgi:DNA repair exonuclease SbcCD nuclease subunit